MTVTVEIKPADGRKSFWGKAKMVQYDGTEYWTVQSYGREVALIKKTYEGMVEVIRLWCNYSHTTLRHINGAINMLGAVTKITKTMWNGIVYKESVVVE